jgi:hypothetical protein
MGPAGPMRPFYLSNAALYLNSETQNIKIWNSTNNDFIRFHIKNPKDKFRDITRLRLYKLFQPRDKFLVLSNQAWQISHLSTVLLKRNIELHLSGRWLSGSPFVRMSWPFRQTFSYCNCTYILLWLKLFPNLSNTHKELCINVSFARKKIWSLKHPFVEFFFLHFILPM